MAISPSVISYLQSLGMTPDQIQQILSAVGGAEGNVSADDVKAAAARFMAALASGNLVTGGVTSGNGAGGGTNTGSTGTPPPPVDTGMPAGDPNTPMQYGKFGPPPGSSPADVGAFWANVANYSGAATASTYDVAANPYHLFNPGATAAVGTVDAPSGGGDTVGRANYLANAIKNGITPNVVTGTFANQDQVNRAFVEQLAGIVASGSTYYSGYNIDPESVAVARKLAEAHPEWNLNPTFMAALRTGTPEYARSLDVASLGTNQQGLYGPPLTVRNGIQGSGYERSPYDATVGAFNAAAPGYSGAGVPPGNGAPGTQTQGYNNNGALGSGFQTWSPTSTQQNPLAAVDPARVAQLQAAIAAQQKNVATYSAVKAPSDAQKANLAIDQATLLKYQKELAGYQSR